MTEVFGAQWANAYGRIGGPAFETWRAAMGSFSEDDLRRGCELMISQSVAEANDNWRFPPNLMQFLALLRAANPRPTTPPTHELTEEGRRRSLQARDAALAALPAGHWAHSICSRLEHHAEREGRPDGKTTGEA